MVGRLQQLLWHNPGYVLLISPFVPATDYHVSPVDWQHSQPSVKEELFKSVLLEDEDCEASRKSVMALAVTCALLLVLYVCTVFCICTSKKVMGKSDDTYIGGVSRNSYIAGVSNYIR